MRWFGFYLFVLLIAPAVPGNTEDMPEWTQCTARPNAEITNDGIIAACTSVLDAAKEPPDRLAIAVFSRGLAYHREGKRDQAQADYDKTLGFNPKFAKVFVARGYDAIGDGKYQAAVQEFTQAIKFDPKLVEAYYGRGLAYGADRQIDRSIEDHQKAIKLDPKYAQAYFGLGLEYRDKGQFGRAIESYNKAIELDPKYAQALYNRGNAYGAQNQIDRAIADYNAAIQIEPDYAKALFMRGLAYRDTGKTDQALADLNEAIRLNPNFPDATQQREKLLSSIAAAPPASDADKKQEDALFGLYMARAGNIVCSFSDIDDAEKAALDGEIAKRIGSPGVTPLRAQAIEARTQNAAAEQKKTDPKFCASDGEFAGMVREMFDASADRPKRQQ
jgi:tetratricopeptide (TPR) repeat protein